MAKATNEWLKKKLIKVMEWPSQSADLKPFNICGGSWRFELPNDNLKSLTIWRGFAKKSGTKSLPRGQWKLGNQQQKISGSWASQQGFLHQVLTYVLEAAKQTKI